MEQVSDLNDLASLYEQSSINASIAHFTHLATRAEMHPGFDGESCVACGDGIPNGRLSIGKVRCTHCQSEMEFRNRFFVK